MLERKIRLANIPNHVGKSLYSPSKPLPSDVEKMLAEMDGKITTVDKAQEALIGLEARIPGKLQVFEGKTNEPNMIGLRIFGTPFPTGYELLNFKYLD